MEVEADIADLAPAVDFVARSCERRNTIPVLACVRLEASDGKLTIEGTTFDRTARATVSADTTKPGAICVSAEMLTKLCKAAPKGARATFSLDDTMLAFAAGRTKARLVTQAASDWPNMHKEPPEMAEIDPEAFCTALSGAVVAASQEESRWYLTGVYLNSDRAVATDGHRLIAFDIPTSHDAILSYRDVPEICRLLEKGGRFGASPDKWRAETETRALFGKCVEGSFPDVDRIMVKSDPAALFDRDAFLEAVAAVSLGTRTGVAVTGKPGDELTLVCRPRFTRFDADGSEITATVSADVKRDICAGLNAGYLRDVLGAMPDAEIAMTFNDEESPVLFEPSDGSAFLGRRAIVMAMRMGTVRTEQAA